MSVSNSKPKAAPVIVLREEPSEMGRYMFLTIPALIGSTLFHAILVGAFVLYVIFMQPTAVAREEEEVRKEVVQAEQVEKKDETFTVKDVDESRQEFDTDIQYQADRIADVSVPGTVNASEAVGIKDGDMSTQPFNIPAPGGFLTKGQGGAIEVPTGPTTSMAAGEVGGYSPRGLPLQGTFYGRSGATREYALREGGGTSASEAAVTRGLQWLVRQQNPMNGAWALSGTEGNEVAGTALGLLPFLAAGKTHKPAQHNPYDKTIMKGLNYLKKVQNKETGYFGGGMYAHGLATIAMCEAYGLSQDPTLRPYAQKAIKLIENAQSPTKGSWDYGPAPSDRPDMSVSGWQIMALKSGMMAGLNVQPKSIDRTKKFLDAANNQDNGYGYSLSGSTPRMSAVGLLCRQYMNNWGPSNPKMIDGVDKHLTPTGPNVQDCYFYYYATQVLHHFGGESWKKWNDVMRENLIRKQEKNEKNANFGSWSPEGDPWARVGGRLMITSLNLLTLEVYYRYLPLYYRDAGYGKDMVMK